MDNALLDNNQLSSEFFYIDLKEVDPQTGKIWDDHDTGAEKHVAFWKVDPSPGFFSLGHYATDYREIDAEVGHLAPTAITLKPKPGYDDLLVAPSGYEKIWDDEDSGGSSDCGIWRIVCPEGYVALGDFVTDFHHQPTDPGSVRCIKKTALSELTNKMVSLVASAGYLDFADSGDPKAFWTDKDSGANKHVSIWLMRPNGRPSARNQVYLMAGTFKASRHHNIPPAVDAYALLLNFPQNDIMEKVEMESRKFKLTSATLPTEEELKASAVTKRYQVPFFAVADNMYKNQLQQFKKSPVYTIERVTRYEAIDGFEPINTETKEFSVTIGKSQESNYSNEVGIALGVSVEVGGEAGIPIGKTSFKATVSVEASYSHSWGGATSEYEERSFMYPQTVTGGYFGVLFQAMSTYTIYRQDGTPVGAPVEVKTNQFYTDEWRPEGINLAAASEDGQKETVSPNTITFTIVAPPGKIIILEGRLEIRDGQLISTPAISITSTVADAPQTDAAPVGTAQLFDNSTPPIVVGKKLSSSYTKEAWIKIPASVDTTNYCNIISGGSNGKHAFCILNHKVIAGHNEKWDCVKCDEPISENWEHYAVTYDVEIQEMKLYRNGKLINQNKTVPPFSGENFVQIGGYNTPATNKFIGKMAEARIWNQVRTEDQIASQMKVSVSKATPGLIAKYPED